MRILVDAKLTQQPDGLFTVQQDLTRPGLAARRFSVSLQTTNPVIAYLLYMQLAQRIDAILVRHGEKGLEDARYIVAMKQIAELIQQTTSSLPPAEPLPAIPSAMVPATQSKSSPSEPAALALMTALGSLLSKDKRQRLEALLNDENESFFSVDPTLPDSESMTVIQLIEHYEATQLQQGAWRNPRTRISVRARLEAMSELLGGHRTISTLSRADMVALRERIRDYPKNRNKLNSLRHVPLAQLMDDPSVESLNPRTTKKFFELIRAVMRHAHDYDLLKSDIASNLVFKIKGAEAPRKRTYTPRQVEMLLQGPALTLDAPPKWRLDDYKFWLPLLGLYTGCRLAELCQLQLADVRLEEHVWVIHISRSGNRQLKTKESERLVPLHHALLSMGFLEFVQSRRTSADDEATPLFDKLKAYPTLATSHIASKWFLGQSNGNAGYLGLCGLGDDHLTFHGLRHTFIQQFRRQKLDILIAMALVGHEDKSTTGGYGDVYPAAVLKEEIDKINYGTSLEHIQYENYIALRKRQGMFRTGRPARLVDA